jgi:branched-chain amino acid transport system substrate-binding protein
MGAAAGAGAASSLGLLGQTASAQAAKPLRIGFISSLSGAQAPLGQPMLLGAQIAVDQINKAGGVNGQKLELVVRDDKAKPTDATVAARELTGDGVNLLCGVVSSSVALAISAMLEQQNALLITCAAHSDKLTKENFVPNYFRGTDNPPMRERALARMAAQRYPEVLSWGSLIPDHEFGRTTWACFLDGLAEFYPSLAKKEPTVYQPIKTAYGAADYRSSITTAMGVPAEGFLVAAYGDDAVTLYKQAGPFGFYKKTKLIVDPANEFIVAKAMKQELPDMWVGSHWYFGAFDNVATSRELQAEAVRRTGIRLTEGFVGEGHAAVMAYAKAVQAAGGADTTAVRRALEEVTFDTATGPRRFRKEDHQAIKPVIMYRLRGNAKSSDGFDIVESLVIPAEDVIDPPTPGKPMQLRTLPLKPV